MSPPLRWPYNRGRVSDPAQPLRAAHNLKPPALPGDIYNTALSGPSVVSVKPYNRPTIASFSRTTQDEVAGS
jgi:hypothetical protein